MPYSILVAKQKHLGQTSNDSNGHLSADKEKLIVIGGLEGNLTQARYLANISAESEIFDRPTANLYVAAKLATPLYGLSGRNKRAIEGQGPIKNAREKAWLNLVDPFVFSAIMKNRDFIADGDYDAKFPWLMEVNDLKLTPYLSYTIVPFGESYGFNTIFRYAELLQSCSFNITNNIESAAARHLKREKGYRLDYRIKNLPIGPNLSLSLRIDFAKDPFFLADMQKTNNAYAGGGGLAWNLRNDIKIGAGLLKKTAGYIPDQTIHGGTIWDINIQYPYF